MSVLDTAEFRKALGAFATGVTAVTTCGADGAPRGLTANSFTSVSLDPPLILVCIARTAASCATFAECRHFAVTVLSQAQKPLSILFASKAAEKFAQAAWSPTASGAPVIDGGAAWFHCAREKMIEAGDHLVLLGRVLEFSHTAERPLGYCRGAYVDFGLSEDAVAALGQRMRVGAILEQDNCLLLLRRSDGQLTLPAGTHLGPASDPASLRHLLARYGLIAALDFLFAVFEGGEAGADSTSIYYRGAVDGVPARHSVLHLAPLEHVPFDLIADDAIRSMLRRYVDERQEDSFGIYVGGQTRGVVHGLAAHPTSLSSRDGEHP